MKGWYQILMLVMVWLLVVLFAHDYVSQNINETNQTRLELIDSMALNYRWPMQSSKEVVASFRDAWQVSQLGLQSEKTDLVAMSLDLEGQWIDPEIQQSLLLLFETDSESAVQVKFEFSDQSRQLYYDSPDLSLTDLSQPFALNDVLWQATTSQEPGMNGRFYPWHELVPLDALVVRFMFTSPAAITVHEVKIIQTHDKSVSVDECKERLITGVQCHITNQMNELGVSWQQKEDAVMSFSVLSTMYWFWLFAAWGVSILTAGFMSRRDQWLSLMGLVSLVFGVVLCLHQAWISSYFNFLRWPLLLLFLCLVFQYRRFFQKPQDPAWLFLASSLLVAVVMLLVAGDVDFSFLRGLPFYFIWAWVQQLILGPVVIDLIHPKLKVSKFMTACLVGVLFSIIHTPNHMLMLATLLGGVMWSYAWLKYRNLYANAFSHALLALVYYQVMPPAWLGTARIGVFF